MDFTDGTTQRDRLAEEAHVDPKDIPGILAACAFKCAHAGLPIGTVNDILAMLERVEKHSLVTRKLDTTPLRPPYFERYTERFLPMGLVRRVGYPGEEFKDWRKPQSSAYGETEPALPPTLFERALPFILAYAGYKVLEKVIR